MDVYSMRAGRMDRIISLYQESNTTNDFGEQITTWIPLCVVGAELSSGTLTIGTLYQITATETNHFYTGCAVGDVWTATVETALDADNKVKPVIRSYQEWAERRELRGDERWSAQQVVAKIACKYRIRYRDDVGPLNILIDGDREYDIHAALELGRREGLELIVSARGE
jgi:head-tail adaptor